MLEIEIHDKTVVLRIVERIHFSCFVKKDRYLRKKAVKVSLGVAIKPWPLSY